LNSSAPPVALGQHHPHCILGDALVGEEIQARSSASRSLRRRRRSALPCRAGIGNDDVDTATLSTIRSKAARTDCVSSRRRPIGSAAPPIALCARPGGIRVDVECRTTRAAGDGGVRLKQGARRDGGMHLFPADEEYLRRSVAELKTLNPDVVIPMHARVLFCHCNACEQMPDR